MPDDLGALEAKHKKEAEKLAASQKAELAILRLQHKYDVATEAFRSKPSDKTKAAYKKAKQAFVDARQAQRRIEEADPDHRRGTGIVFVTDEEG